MRPTNENVYITPGFNIFGCTYCGREKCHVHVPVSLELFYHINTYGAVEITVSGRRCKGEQRITLQRPAPPPLLKPHEIEAIVKRLMARWKDGA